MADENQDWYAILGVERTATTKEITKAYRQKALKVHPDKNPDPNAAKIFHELSQAYDLLLDPAARQAFDNLLNVKVQAKERTDRYDSTRKKMKEDLEMRENAFRKQQQDEKTAAMRMHYEMERLKKENAKMREQREADLLRQAGEFADLMEATKQAAREEEIKSLDCTLSVKWNKKKYPLKVDQLTSQFEKFGPVDSCVSLKEGSAVIAFKEITGAYAVMKAKERESGDLNKFRISWAGGEEPAAVASLRAKDSTGQSTPPLQPLPLATPSSSSTPSTSRPNSTRPSISKPAFNTPAFTPAFSTPAFGGGASAFGSFPSTIPSFGAPPSFNVSREVPLVDDYEAATLARMKSKDNERKRLAEEMLRMDQEEEERLEGKKTKE
ncbi:DnaJ homolog subfamily C member 17 [Entomortierella parvispora]|uniref:DnaJ homolog subfamily C member 17 n=1 Tax=Entomortierella parvispora TaxID=205924 RepID=A0A9P3M0D3_9FUNG|nr:DnaJ homolog subfamily C member 17 [Entomortierella parvispora]